MFFSRWMQKMIGGWICMRKKKKGKERGGGGGAAVVQALLEYPFQY